MLDFIVLLRERYQILLVQLEEKNALALRYEQRIEQLIFAEAFIRKGALLKAEFKLPPQIAVIGPTQAGKSSVCNLLLNNSLAGVSVLAGYTVHPQGFCVGVNDESSRALQQYFGRYQQLTAKELPLDRYDCFALSNNPTDAPLLPPCILWDTPDFDSISAPDYKEGVIRTIALADIVILVLSKEKYADQSVWALMSQIEVFNQPTLIFINKVPKGSEGLIIRSLKQKWQQSRDDIFPETVPLFYQKETGQPHWDHHPPKLLYQLVKKSLKRHHFRYQSNLIYLHWRDWISPVIIEHEALEMWEYLIATQIEQALVLYQRDYLEHPDYYETFQQALIELLNLLEIPGIAKILTKTRRILTWPIRKLLGLRKKSAVESFESQELQLLNQQADDCLIQLTDHLLEKIDANGRQNMWWNEVYRLLRQQRAHILENFKYQSKHYYHDFQKDIEHTAQKLYKKLEEKPFILNSLRTTRISADAATIALVIQTGGLGIYDVVITPAMLSLTSLLTETAIGGYMNKTEAQLKKHQLATVKQQLFIQCLQQPLSQLPHQIPDNHHFNISPEQLAVAEQQRVEKKHGLRLF
jgi:hypothetical protein